MRKYKIVHHHRRKKRRVKRRVVKRRVKRRIPRKSLKKNKQTTNQTVQTVFEQPTVSFVQPEKQPEKPQLEKPQPEKIEKLEQFVQTEQKPEKIENFEQIIIPEVISSEQQTEDITPLKKKINKIYKNKYRYLLGAATTALAGGLLYKKHKKNKKKKKKNNKIVNIHEFPSPPLSLPERPPSLPPPPLPPRPNSNRVSQPPFLMNSRPVSGTSSGLTSGKVKKPPGPFMLFGNKRLTVKQIKKDIHFLSKKL